MKQSKPKKQKGYKYSFWLEPDVEEKLEELIEEFHLQFRHSSGDKYIGVNSFIITEAIEQLHKQRIGERRTVVLPTKDIVPQTQIQRGPFSLVPSMNPKEG